MLRFIDGYDSITDGQAPSQFKYDASPLFAPNFPQVIAGKPGPTAGHALWLFNQAFSQIEMPKIVGASSRLGIHVDFWQQPYLGHLGAVEWFCFRRGTQNLLTLYHRTDGRMDVRRYTSPTLFTTLATPSFQFSDPTSGAAPNWHTVEFQADFGASSAWTLRANGSTVGSGTCAPLLLADRAVLRAQNFGPPAPAYDNYAIWDGAGSEFADFIGPSIISTLLCSGDVLSDWQRNSAGPQWAAIQDPGRLTGGLGGGDMPDSDATYISPLAPDAKAFFLFGSSLCFGNVMAVAVNLCARATAGSPSLRALVRLAGVEYDLGAVSLSTDYRTRQIVVPTNPATGGMWLDADISRAQWGVQADASTAARLTQYYIEKLTTLSGAPYHCGGGSSYSFGH